MHKLIVVTALAAIALLSHLHDSDAGAYYTPTRSPFLASKRAAA